MKSIKFKSYQDFKSATLARVRGLESDIKPNTIYFESFESLLKLLNPENRMLLKTIRDKLPQSINELSKLTNRAEPNLLRSLNKLAACGFVDFKTEGRRKIPFVTVKKFTVEIDPFEPQDRLVA